MKKQKKRKPRISQCMIVKNEEKNIERALSWGKEIMWEQIVVDTGSTDRTVELAEGLGAKVCHFDWIDDFSAAKNYAIEQAKGDWIVFLDADEYMTARDARELHGLIQDIERGQASYLVIYMDYVNESEDGTLTRMGNNMRVFRRHRDLRYKGRIHEYVEKGSGEWEASDMLDGCGELTIYHTGGTDEAFLDTGKRERNIRLLQKELEERPDDYFMLGYLGNAYVTMGEKELAAGAYERAVRAYEKAGRRPVRQNEHISGIFASLLECLCERGEREERILEVYEEAVRAVTGESDFDYVVGMHFIGTGDWERAVRHLERALAQYQEYGNLFWGERLSRNLMAAREYLTVACFNAGQREKCAEHCILFLREDRFAMGILKVLLAAFRSWLSGEEGARQTLELLGKLYDLSAVRDRLFVLKAARETGHGELESLVWSLFSPQEQMALAGKI